MTSAPKVGVVGIKGAWSSEALADALAELTGHRLLIEMPDVRIDSSQGVATCDGVDLCQLDALVIKKIGVEYSPDMLDRLELLRFVEARGVRCFSKPRSIMALLDRLSCTITLASGGIPMPPTCVTENVDEAVDAIRGFERVVLKPLYSTKARGMMTLAADEPDLRSKVEAFQQAGNPMLYVQKMLELPGGDLGVMFLGGRYLDTYARIKADKSWNSTIHSGGRYEKYSPSDEVIALAERAQALFDLEFTSVDVVETENGPMVFEVSAFGGFRGLRDGCGLDAARLYAEHVVSQLN